MKQLLITILLFCSISIICTAQSVKKKTVKKKTIIIEEKIDLATDTIYKEVDIDPDFIGGDSALNKYLFKKYKVPADAKRDKIEGNLFVKFVVRKNGTITEVEILRGLCTTCDVEAIRVVKKMPRWKPGKLNNKNVSTRISIPININFEDNE
jgi:protein TonB